MLKKKIAIVGCGKLATIVAKAFTNGLLHDYAIVGAYSRSLTKAEEIARIVNNTDGNSCSVCHSFEEVMALKPDYIVEMASPTALKEIARVALENGASIITLSIGALADEAFYRQIVEVARQNNTRIHIASGAIGGLDVLRTVSLMGDCELNFDTCKGPNSLKGTQVYDDQLQTEQKSVFEGSAKEAIQLFPTKVNVAVAASIASVGPANSKVTITSIPGYEGDDHRITIKNDQVHAVIDVYSRTAEIAGWSMVNTLRNIASPIVF
ncbi:MAG: DUF108 domain-containing protein [Breznakibacter sp.]|nr:DUF108 domain-containing protein [Breznakibacter sp.]